MGMVLREDNWQLKFTQIYQDICDIKSKSYSSNKINNQKMTIMSTQLGSTSILDNHKLPGSYSYVKGEQDDTYSQYKPLLDRTKDHNLDSQANCEIPLFSTRPTPPPVSWMLPWSPAPPPILRSLLWWPSSISPSDERGDTTVQNKSLSPNDTSEFGVAGPIGEDGEEVSPRAESSQWEMAEVAMEGGPPDPDPPRGTSGPCEAPETSPPDPSRTAVRMNLINASS